VALLRRRVVDSGPVRPAPVVRPPIGPAPEGRPKLGEILRGDDAITEAELASALSHQEASGRRLGAILIDQAVINDRTLAEELATQFEIPLADLRHEIPQVEATALVTEVAARSLTLIPLRLDSGKLRVALADPLDTRIADLLAVLPVDEVELHLAPAEEIRSAINSCYRALAQVGEHVEAFRVSEDERSALEPAGRVDVDEDAPVIQIVNKVVTQALRDRASDIHIEPSNERLRIRFRIDGAARQRCVDVVGLAARHVLRNALAHRGLAGRAIEEHEPWPHRFEDAVLAVENLLHLRSTGHAQDHDIGLRRDIFRRGSFFGALRHQVFDGLAILVRHHGDFVPLLQEVLGHAVAHQPDSDEPDLLCHGRFSSRLEFPR
jgi:hypothetical protein